MKLLFIRLFMDAATDPAGGFSETETAQLTKAIGEMKTEIKSDNLKTVEEKLKEHKDIFNEALKKFANAEDFTKLNDAVAANQKGVDEVLIKLKDMQKGHGEDSQFKSRSLQEAMAEALQDKDNQEGMKSVGKGRSFTLNLKGLIDMSRSNREIYNPNAQEAKAVGDMTQANILTGQGYASYNERQVILPSQKVNARDLVDTVHSPTGIYVTYRETAGQGSVSKQTEGSAKTQIDFRFSEIKIVLDYIAAWTKISKQLMTNLPYMQSTLPALLKREFFKVENRRFYDIMATAAGVSGIVPDASDTDDLLQVMDWITQLADTDYSPSYGVLRYTALNRINKSILTKGYYPGAGGVTSGPSGNIMINGTPVYPVTWVPSYDKFLVFDKDYVQRVEVDSLKIEFFEQDSDNVEKNLITARIECQEDFNEMQPLSLILGDLGNSASS